MKRHFLLQSGLVAIALLGLGLPQVYQNGQGQPDAVYAQAFGQQDVDQSKFAVLAVPLSSGNAYQLWIMEQITDKRPCWSESGSNPIIVDPLWTQFDFTGICGRRTDANGYSLRMANRDFGLIYSLRVVRQGNDLVLQGVNFNNRDAVPVEIGRTNGIPPEGAFAKFVLNPGWRLTQRTQQGKNLGHVYVTNNDLPFGVQLPSAFADIQIHWARQYIDALAARKIISGFEDGSFRPEQPVTRAQFASIVSNAFGTGAVPSSSPAPQTSAYKDVPGNFWANQWIATAAQLGFMSGYPDSTFKPNQPIPRVQVLAALSTGLKLTPTTPELVSFYQDSSQIPTWATNQIAAATERQIVVNYPRLQQLEPTREATRAEVAAFVYQALVNAGRLPAIPSPYVVTLNPQPSPQSSPQPVPQVSPQPTLQPSPSPFPQPTIQPSPVPSLSPVPSPQPSIPFSPEPFPSPTIQPSPAPIVIPNPQPLPSPTPQLSPEPFPSPTIQPSPQPVR